MATEPDQPETAQSEADPVEPTVFSLIIRGDIPGRFVWRDDDVVAFLTIAPIRPGHVLVVPVEQIDHWTDLPTDLWLRINEVALAIGQSLRSAYPVARVASIIAGLEVPHCHVHLIPIESESQLSFANADPSIPGAELDAVAARIREHLRADGRGDHVPDA